MARNQAFTLLEVILALVILAGALAVTAKLTEIATRNALFAQYHHRAIQLAESKMGEVVAGLVPLASTGAQSFEEDPDWQWQLQVADGPLPGLKVVSIAVFPAPGGRLATSREPVHFELVRYFLPPDYVASVALSGSATNGARTGTNSSLSR
jgi:type II secretion system protein I